ncbi:hypothetical protein [Allostreptomyces psammosilenae]|uniref:Uncharacterized protein n=1 Tax=Allostreptomyces psammosilenae TaxID=1892865 RepID=A0A852ZLH4_9ACTN|nr:hypothetical protein [Allostreptomyces psammosilenae]NYI03249.1 hypothetical protein [Allostreptomyces psammosilenae]
MPGRSATGSELPGPSVARSVDGLAGAADPAEAPASPAVEALPPAAGASADARLLELRPSEGRRLRSDARSPWRPSSAGRAAPSSTPVPGRPAVGAAESAAAPAGSWTGRPFGGSVGGALGGSAGRVDGCAVAAVVPGPGAGPGAGASGPRTCPRDASSPEPGSRHGCCGEPPPGAAGPAYGVRIGYG